MAIDTGTSLDSGASDITYTGNEGPRDPRAMTDIEKIILQHWMQQGGSYGDDIPEEFRQQIMQIYGLNRDRSASGGIARLGYDLGGNVRQRPHQPRELLVNKTLSGERPKYQPPGGGATSLGSGRDYSGSDRGPRDDPDRHGHTPVQNVHQTGAVSQTPYNPVAEAVAQAEEVQNEINRIENHPRIPEQTKKDLISDIIDQPMLGDTGGSMDHMSGVRPSMLGDTGGSMDYMGSTMPAHLGDTGGSMDYMGSTMPAHLGDVGGSMDYMGSTMPAHLGDTGGSMDYMIPPVVPTGDGGGDGEGLGGGTGITSVPIDTTADAEDPFAEAKAAAIAEAQAAAETRGLPFKDYYVGGDPTEAQEKFMREHQAAASMVGREAWPAAEGGVARQRYGLGSLVKKAFKAVKKIAKSPIGKAALMAGLGYFGPKFLGAGKAGFGQWGNVPFLKSALQKKIIAPSPQKAGWLRKALGNPMTWIAGASALPFVTQGEEEQTWPNYYGPGLDIPLERKTALAGNVDQWRYPFLPMSKYAADGGRIGYKDAGPVGIEELLKDLSKEEIEKLLEQLSGKVQDAGDMRMASDPGMGEGPFMYQEYLDAVRDGFKGSYDEFIDQIDRSPWDYAAQGGRIGYANGGLNSRMAALNQLYGINDEDEVQYAQEGGLMDLGGMEKDYRQEGGFVPIGGQERADDVPARLSKNEFVFTADAVRAAGGGDIDKGAEVMENVMDNLEQGGQVSQESQGLEGARNMFATAQRLEGVL